MDRRNEMQWPKKRRMQSVDFDLGEGASNSPRRCSARSRAWQGASPQEGEEEHGRSSNTLSRKAVQGRMRRQHMEQCWMEEKSIRSGPARSSRKREEVHAALQYAVSFHCPVCEWHNCEELFFFEPVGPVVTVTLTTVSIVIH